MAKRHKYSQDYKVLEVSNKSKAKPSRQLIYTGNYYRFEDMQNGKQKIKRIFPVLMLLSVAFFGIAGLLNNEGSRKVYVILPYVFLFLPIFYGCMGTVKLLLVKDHMTRVEHDHSIVRMRKSTIALLVLSITSFLGEVIYLIRSLNEIVSVKEYLFLFCMVAIAGISYVLIQVQNRYKTIEIKQA